MRENGGRRRAGVSDIYVMFVRRIIRRVMRKVVYKEKWELGAGRGSEDESVPMSGKGVRLKQYRGERKEVCGKSGKGSCKESHV